VAVGPGTHMPCRLVPQGCRPMCHSAWPHHRSVGAAPEAMPSVDLSRFAPMDEMELTRIHRPTVIHMEAPIDLGTTLPASFGTCWLHNRH